MRGSWVIDDDIGLLFRCDASLLPVLLKEWSQTARDDMFDLLLDHLLGDMLGGLPTETLRIESGLYIDEPGHALGQVRQAKATNDLAFLWLTCTSW